MIRLKPVIFATGIFPMITAVTFANETSIHSSFRPPEQRKTSDLYAQFLYWFTSETMDFAYVEKGSSNDFDHSYKILDFDGAPGFRVGLGYNLSYDGLDTQFSYTWFHAKASSQAKGRVTSLSLAARLSALEPFDEIRASSGLHYNIFDGDLGRNFFISKQVAIRPFVGIKGGWIHQTIHADFSKYHVLDLINIYGQDVFRNDFNGVGPKGGIMGKMLFGDANKGSLSILGAFDAGFLWGRWKVSDKFQDTLDTHISLVTTPRNFGATVFHSLLGLAWDCSFNKNRKHFSAQLAYEIEDWLNYLQIFTNISGSQNSDLILQGVNFGIRVDF
jgi:hypothetical protein